MASNMRSFLGRGPSRPILMTYPIPAEGIEWQILQENIHTFLGPEACARVHFDQRNIKQYLITTTRPFTRSQLNDLRAFSAEMIEDNTEGFGFQRFDYYNSAQAYQGCHSNHNINNRGNHANCRTQGASIVQLQINFPIVQNPLVASAGESYHNSAITCHNCHEPVIPKGSQGESWERCNRPFGSPALNCTFETLY